MGTAKLLLGLLEALEKRKQRLSKPFWNAQALKLTLKKLDSRKVFPFSKQVNIYPGSEEIWVEF